MKTYIGIDGDRVGEKIEALVVARNLKGATDLSRKVKLAIEQIEKVILSSGGKVIFSGGDGILAEAEFDKQQCNDLVRIFYDTTGCTASAGIGSTPVKAYLALKLAKGFNVERVVDYRSVSRDRDSL